MQLRVCEVIGCAESAAWVRTAHADASLEDFLCSSCWLRLAEKQPCQAAFYVACNPGAIPPSPPPRVCIPQATHDTILIR